MAEPFLGQIEAFAFGYAPRGWMACQGQVLAINQYQALFSLLGTTFGGNGTSTFALPDLRGRVAMGQGNGNGLTLRIIGQSLGEDTHTILLSETPNHTHSVFTAPNASTENNVDTPGNTVVLGPATATKGTAPDSINLYAPTPPAPVTPLAPTALTITSGGKSHPNMMPYLAIEFCIAISGIFPSRD